MKKTFLLALLGIVPAILAAQDPITVITVKEEAKQAPVTVTVYSETDGTGYIKPMHCSNGMPGLKRPDDPARGELFQALGIPYVRVHDEAHNDPGLHPGDLNHIFPLFKLDASVRENYNFAPSDAFMANIVSSGSKPYFRLGSSIENMDEYHYEIDPPDNYRKWAEIACNVIEHYNNGKWDGFHYGIEYWEIWNEPENRHCWSGDLETYAEFYITVSKYIKKRFPDLKIGGPAFTSSNEDKCTDFIRACSAADAPLDFFSYHNYIYSETSDARFIHGADRVRQLLDMAGYTDTEIHLNEWHPIKGWRNPDKRVTPDLSSLITSLLIGFQDTPIDKSFFYTTTSSDWGVFDYGTKKPNEAWYALYAFNRFYRSGDTRLRLKADGMPDMCRSMASRDGDGNAAILAALFNSGKRDITFDWSALGQFAQAQVWLYDAAHKFVKIQDIAEPAGKTTVCLNCKSATVFVRLFKEMQPQEEADVVLSPEVKGSWNAFLGGGVHAPRLKSAGNHFRDNFWPNMKLPVTRICGEALQNSGMRLVDVNLIFPVGGGNPNSRDYYDFRATDDFLKQIYKTGTGVYWCLSAFPEEKWDCHFGIEPPQSPEKWAQVCSNIISHYNKGKWDGFRYGIKNWEIWHSPDSKDCWGGTFDEYISFYSTVAKILKKEHPDINVGGPSLSSYDPELIKKFVDGCKASGAPLDFLSFKLGLNPAEYDGNMKIASRIREILDEAGYNDTKINLCAWSPLGKTGVDLAAASCQHILGWQDSALDMALFDSVCEKTYAAQRGTPFYHMFVALAEMQKRPALLDVRMREHSSGMNVAAGRDKAGNVSVLAALYRSGREEFSLDFSALGKFSSAEVYVMDERNGRLDQRSVIKNPKDTLRLGLGSENAVVLVRLIK